MDKITKIFIIFLALFLLSAPTYSKGEDNNRDYLYSQEYFDYLIECASIQKNEEEAANETQEEISYDEIIPEESYITSDYEPFKLRIQDNSRVNPYGETFKKEDSKTIIPLGDKFSIIQDTTTIKNKYSSTDYRVLAGVEYSPFKFVKISGGLETNYRGLEQNPNSRKIYFIPSFTITDKLSISFYNKMNVLTKETDFDIGLNLSPFKSKAVDFSIYAGSSRTPSGTHSESINFRTNLYLF